MENKEVIGRLENWFIAFWGDGTKDLVVWGDIYDDKRKRFKDGLHIHTSYLIEINESNMKDVKEGDVIKTKNSYYLLGKKYERLNKKGILK